MYQEFKRIIFILPLLVLVVILVRTMIINGLIKKTVIRLNSSIYRTLSYQDYEDNCLIEKKYLEKDCEKIKDLIYNYQIKGYNRMIWEKSDYNCSDFDNWHLAQNFFDYTNGKNIDWYGLDKEHGGVACFDLAIKKIIE